MPEMIVYSECPACGSKNLHQVLSAKDHTVSMESFEVWECGDCHLRFTQGVPGEENIGRYYQSDDYISHSDTKKGLINGLYHWVRKRTLLEKKKWIETATGTRAGRILDVGAGTGAFLNAMRTGGWQVRGVEPDATARAKARELYRLELLEAPHLFSLEAGSYDVITLWHVLEHVHRLHAYLDELKKLLAPGGKVLIAVPNYTSLDARTYGSDWAAYDVPRHLYHFSPRAMKALLSMHGFQVEKVQPMWYDSVYVSLLSETYRTGHSRPLSAFLIGMRSNLQALFDKTSCSSLTYIATAR